MRRIRAGDFEKRRNTWLSVSSTGQYLVRGFLVLEEAQRLTCDQALQHRWNQSDDLALPSCMSDSKCSQLVKHNGRRLSPIHVPKVLALLLRIPRLATAQRLALTACAIAATELDLEALVPWRDLFLDLDRDRDGRLSIAEMVQGLKRLLGDATSWRMTDERLESCSRALDLDQSGAIEWVEWVAMALLGTRGISDAVEPLSTAFRLIDRPVVASGSGVSAHQVTKIIADWAPKSSLADAEQDTFTLAHLRLVFSSLEVYEML